LERTVGSERSYQPHKLIIPVLLASEVDPAYVRSTVAELFGDPDLDYGPIPFTFTDFYDNEMGHGIRRMLFSVRDLVNPEDLAELKITANRLEDSRRREDGSRTVNADPGLLSLSRVILATTKASAHRVPIGNRIHAEITLLYQRGRYQSLEWTYPDFASGTYDEWLARVREEYHRQLKEIDPGVAWRL